MVEPSENQRAWAWAAKRIFLFVVLYPWIYTSDTHEQGRVQTLATRNSFGCLASIDLAFNYNEPSLISYCGAKPNM